MLNQNYQNNDLRKKIEDYSYGLKDIIGRGFSSVVYKGLNDKTKQKVAIKVIDIRSIQGKPQKKMLDGEVDALKKLNHTNILKCLDIFSTANNCYIITQFCNEGDLEHLLKKRQKLSEQQAIPFIRQILMGFLAIAESGFLHRDLKPANILIKDKNIKIADFGFAKRATSNSKEAINVGSPLYMSPEALQSNIYTIKNDIWSIGVIMYEILHGKAPWACKNEKQLIEEINKNNISMLKNISEELKDFIRKCLTPDQKRRFTIKQLTSHPFACNILNQSIPLLRKITSLNENTQIPISQDLKTIQVQNYASNSNRPKILHHRNGNSSHLLEKQLLCQFNWLKFLYRLSQMFPEISESGRYTLGLRFIVSKQLLSQLNAISESLLDKNIFNFEGWSEFLKNEQEKQKIQKSLEEHRKKYQPHLKQIKQWIPIVGRDKRLSSLADCNLQRSQFLSMQGIYYAIEQCRSIWTSLSESSLGLNQLSQKLQRQAMRLDFIMTYYQLNSFMIDAFHDPQYFTRMSRLQVIMQNRPVSLQLANLQDLQYKMKALQLIK